MLVKRGKQILAALLISLLLLTTTTACATKAPGRFDQVQQESSRQRSGQAVARDATQGSEFNKFFPKAADGYQRVYTQEKKGFAQAKLKRDGKDVALLSISDTSSNPAAATKYSNSDKTIIGYPAVLTGNTRTSILVDNRYQVAVISRDPSFTASDREDWIERFNLRGLAQLN
ncbi:hypothetical protein [Mastigocoleus testarum]|uniref:Uncharacterized protein n=1 Tax=Mastigocoleus testarum BC008 TaxID=371196 RepID=A0A0V7ZTM4_9CYAN|nr:hypothetical protein [Mastigocoleus testarum]KST68020.1 hypothetical protein BC008_32065 [Mastigocoleus testarum BC008]KST68355.1 hypothetical protein BC008_33060 [Mastigocoleus testarum BC008]